MQTITRFRVAPELRQIIAEASRALACLDANRLEELAGCCQALNRDLPPREELARQASEARTDLAVFAHVLEASRANLNVMRRLRDLRMGVDEYGNAKGESR
jgi:hypothetical protein